MQSMIYIPIAGDKFDISTDNYVEHGMTIKSYKVPGLLEYDYAFRHSRVNAEHFFPYNLKSWCLVRHDFQIYLEEHGSGVTETIVRGIAIRVRNTKLQLVPTFC